MPTACADAPVALVEVGAAASVRCVRRDALALRGAEAVLRTARDAAAVPRETPAAREVLLDARGLVKHFPVGGAAAPTRGARR